MKGSTALLILSAVVCGALQKVEATKSKHFVEVYTWSHIDFTTTDDHHREELIANHSFIPGAAIPSGLAIEPHTGRMFVSTPKIKGGIPFSLSTVSDTKNEKGEHMFHPYPDYAMHSHGCDGITSIEAITIDECGRLWVVDMGSEYTKGLWKGYVHHCPAKVMIFDLKTDHVIKEYKMPDDFLVADSSALAKIVVDVVSTDHECKNSFAYISDTGEFDMIVFDFEHDDAWVVNSNAMYPYPDFGHMHYKGIHLDGMYGIYGMALSPKHEDHDRTLYFNSMASARDSYVSTSLLHNKTNFVEDASHDVQHHVYSNIHTFPVARPGGLSCMGPIVDGHLFYGAYLESAVYCWNQNTEYTTEHIVEVDQDEEAFDMFSHLTAFTPEGGVPELYVMTNSFEKFMFGEPEPNEIHFRIMKAPVHKLIEGTACESVVANLT